MLRRALPIKEAKAEAASTDDIDPDLKLALALSLKEAAKKPDVIELAEVLRMATSPSVTAAGKVMLKYECSSDSVNLKPFHGKVADFVKVIDDKRAVAVKLEDGPFCTIDVPWAFLMEKPESLRKKAALRPRKHLTKDDKKEVLIQSGVTNPFFEHTVRIPGRTQWLWTDQAIETSW